MTAEEIRVVSTRLFEDTRNALTDGKDCTQSLLLAQMQMIGEIAAQLAELNAMFAADREYRNMMPQTLNLRTIGTKETNDD